MTSSVNNLDSDPPDRPLVDNRSSVERGRTSILRKTSQTATNNISRRTRSTNDLDRDDSSSSTRTGLGIRQRLDEQKRQNTEMRRKETGVGDASLLAQIQDDLQSERQRYARELDAGNLSSSRTVVCEQDPQTSPAATGNIANTALMDSKVL